LSNSKDLTIYSNGTLFIHTVDYNKAGQYQCVVTIGGSQQFSQLVYLHMACMLLY